MRVFVQSGAILGMLAFAGVFGRVGAQPPAPAVALVLEVEGEVTPALRPFREISSGTTVSLGDRGRLVFLYYASCRTLTVEGGSVAFTGGPAPILKGAATRADVRGQCPRRFSATGSDAVTVMRGSSSLKTSATPEFVFVGRRAEDFQKLRIKSGSKVLVVRPLSDARFLWPADTPPLAPGVYVLDLQSKTAGVAPVAVTFEVSTGLPEAFTLVAID